jgi:hypothetical protein
LVIEFIFFIFGCVLGVICGGIYALYWVSKKINLVEVNNDFNAISNQMKANDSAKATTKTMH